MKKKYMAVVVGGTFDKFHKGHYALLKKAFEVGNHVLIGLSTDSLTKRMKPHKVTAYSDRFKELKNFLEKNNFESRAEIIPINDPYGITLSSNQIDAIVVSKDTEPRAIEINHKRKEKKLVPLKIICINMINSENGIPISSTRIRHKEIDLEGHLLKTTTLIEKNNY